MLSIWVEEREPFTGTDLRLIELSDPHLAEAIQGDEELLIKGGGEEDDEVYLCTADKTLRVRQVHTSNLKLLVDGSSGKVLEVATSFLEAARVPARLERLKEHLMACPYEGVDDAPDPTRLERLRMERIFGDIQASDEEVRRYLHDELGAVLINGHYRIIGSDCTSRFLRTLFSTLILQDWCSADLLDRDALIECLCSDGESEFPAQLVGNLLHLYGEDTDQGWRMDQSKVGRFYARELLRARPVWRLSEFVEGWRRLIGDIEPSLVFLDGIALLETVVGDDDQRVTYFPAEELPLDPASRFRRLFEVCARWELERIEIYVEGAAKHLDVNTLDLIVRHCRISGEPHTGKRIVTPLLPV